MRWPCVCCRWQELALGQTNFNFNCTTLKLSWLEYIREDYVDSLSINWKTNSFYSTRTSIIVLLLASLTCHWSCIFRVLFGGTFHWFHILVRWKLLIVCRLLDDNLHHLSALTIRWHSGERLLPVTVNLRHSFMTSLLLRSLPWQVLSLWVPRLPQRLLDAPR